MNVFVSVLFLALVSVTPVFASPVALIGPIQSNLLGPQSTNNPCIIAATQCQQTPLMGFNNFTSDGAIPSYNMFSTTPTATVADGVQGTPYTVAQLKAAAGTAFAVAIDVNTASGLETLQSFEMIDTTTNTVLFDFTGPHLIGNIANNGNGFGDFALGLFSLAGLAPTDGILFHASWTGATDGGESFFIIPVSQCPDCTPVPGCINCAVPEPGTMLLLGSGLLGLGLVARRRA